MNTARIWIPPCNKIAIETQSIVINCDYRLCPETKYPLPCYDAYAVFKHVVEIAD